MHHHYSTTEKNKIKARTTMMCDLWHVYVNVNFPLQAGFGEMGIA